jgi:hypothetical protein
MQIIVGAMLAGVLSFATIAAVVRSQNPLRPPPDLPILSFVAVGFGVLTLLGRMALLQTVTTAARHRWRAETDIPVCQWLNLFQTRTVIGAALLEGAAFLFLVAYLVEGLPWALAGGLAFGALLALLQFPTRAAVERWVEAQQETFQNEMLGL